jgi:hypothetical protein
MTKKYKYKYRVEETSQDTRNYFKKVPFQW